LNLEDSMKSANGLLSCVTGVILALAASSYVEAGGLKIYVPGLAPVLRGSGFQSFPLAIDSSGDVFTVTGTSPSDQLLEITTSGQVLTVNSAVGGVVGTAGKLAFGFGGDLYSTSVGGVIQFSVPSGAASMFYSNGSASGDAGMVFDQSRQILWVTNVGNSIVGLNSSGNVVDTIPIAGGFYGLALDKSGNLVVMSGQGIIDSINPNTQAITQLANLTSVLPNANIRSMAIDPSTGDLYFTNQFSSPDHVSVGPLDGLYRLNPDGTDLTLVANGFTGQEVFGASSLGNGKTSIYLGDPNNFQLFELQSVPEPSSLVIGATGALVLLGYGSWRASSRFSHPRKV
jgi:hypothetical protein